MKNIKDLKIAGIDSTRPPVIRKEPYIDLVFRLSDRASKEWCMDFNSLFVDVEYSVKINLIDCLYIETWTRTMDEIPEHLEMLKEKVSECNQTFYNRQVELARIANNNSNALADEQGPQGRLNNIIAKLNFN